MIDWPTVLQVLGPPLAVYVGIRSDIAAMKVRVAHLERDLYQRPGSVFSGSGNAGGQGGDR